MNLWPFEKRFQDIPCGREAALTGLLAFPIVGGFAYIFTGNGIRSMRWGTNVGIGLLLLTFIPCRIDFERKLTQARQIQSGINFKEDE